MLRRSLFLACLLTLTANAGTPPQPGPATSPAAAVRPSGVTFANFDKTVRAQDDFYRHVNGAWLARTEIPADRSNYGAFTKLQDDVEAHLKAIDKEAQADGAARGTEQQLVGDFYASFMGEASADGSASRRSRPSSRASQPSGTAPG